MTKTDNLPKPPQPANEGPPPNPYYCRLYTTTINGGYVQVSIPAPGGDVSIDDAEHLKEWFKLIVDSILRKSLRKAKLNEHDEVS